MMLTYCCNPNKQQLLPVERKWASFHKRDSDCLFPQNSIWVNGHGNKFQTPCWLSLFPCDVCFSPEDDSIVESPTFLLRRHIFWCTVIIRPSVTETGPLSLRRTRSVVLRTGQYAAFFQNFRGRGSFSRRVRIARKSTPEESFSFFLFANYFFCVARFAFVRPIPLTDFLLRNAV